MLHRSVRGVHAPIRDLDFSIEEDSVNRSDAGVDTRVLSISSPEQKGSLRRPAPGRAWHLRFPSP